MLTDDEKEKIRLEELYRHEVRTELEEKEAPSAGRRFWAAANKPITIWFLATVVVGAISWSIDQADRKRARERAEYEVDQLKITEEGRLDLEISTRLIQAYPLYVPDDYAAGHVQPALAEQEDILRELIPELHGSFDDFRTAIDCGKRFGVFPEYEHRSLTSLIWQLATLRTPAPEGKLKEALDASIGIKRHEVFWRNPLSFQGTSQYIQDGIMKELKTMRSQLRKLQIGRWHYQYEQDEEFYDVGRFIMQPVGIEKIAGKIPGCEA